MSQSPTDTLATLKSIRHHWRESIQKDWEGAQEAYAEFAEICSTGKPDDPLTFFALGLNEEAGEVAGKIKKLQRGDFEDGHDDAAAAIRAELGDTLWYLTNLATQLRFTLGDLMLDNMDKLIDRRERGVVKGSGDNR